MGERGESKVSCSADALLGRDYFDPSSFTAFSFTVLALSFTCTALLGLPLVFSFLFFSSNAAALRPSLLSRLYKTHCSFTLAKSIIH